MVFTWAKNYTEKHLVLLIPKFFSNLIKARTFSLGQRYNMWQMSWKGIILSVNPQLTRHDFLYLAKNTQLGLFSTLLFRSYKHSGYRGLSHFRNMFSLHLPGNISQNKHATWYPDWTITAGNKKLKEMQVLRHN